MEPISAASSRDESQPGLRLFSSAADAPRRRRANDMLVLGLATVALVGLISLQGPDPGLVDQAWAEALSSWASGVLRPLWEAARVVLALWPLGLAVLCLLGRGRTGLVRDAALAAVLALGLTWVACRVVDVPWPGPSALRRMWSFYRPPVWGFAAMRWLQGRSFL